MHLPPHARVERGRWDASSISERKERLLELVVVMRQLPASIEESQTDANPADVDVNNGDVCCETVTSNPRRRFRADARTPDHRITELPRPAGQLGRGKKPQRLCEPDRPLRREAVAHKTLSTDNRKWPAKDDFELLRGHKATGQKPGIANREKCSMRDFGGHAEPAQ
jgi:hypothetical protein